MSKISLTESLKTFTNIMGSTIMRIFEENPRVAIGTATTSVWAVNWLIFDPHRHCSVFMTILSAVFTYALIGTFTWISFEAWNLHIQEILQTLTSAAGLAGTVFTSYSVWKKMKTNKRKRRITKRKTEDDKN